MDNSNVFYRSIERSASETSFTNQRRILNDNYSLEDIIKLKMRLFYSLVEEVGNLFENESGLPPERSCVQFATFMKEKSNYISSLTNILRMAEPVGFSTFRGEGYIKLNETLQAVSEDLEITERNLQLRGNDFKSRIRSSFSRCKVLEEVMEDSRTNKNEVVLKNEIVMKLSDEKLKASKQDLKYLLDTVFSNVKSLREILEALVEANEQPDGNKRWIKINNKTDISVIMYLQNARIIKSHPLDEIKISLISSD